MINRGEMKEGKEKPEDDTYSSLPISYLTTGKYTLHISLSPPPACTKRRCHQMPVGLGMELILPGRCDWITKKHGE